MLREEILKKLNQLRGKFEKTMGVRIWGVDAGGVPRTVLVTADGKLAVELG